MGSRATISREQILNAACSLAEERGLHALGIRDVAERCGVSVGSVYNYYPHKAELVADAVERYWLSSLPEGVVRTMHASAGLDFLAFCEQAASQLAAPLREFRERWLRDVEKLDARSLAAARAREAACFSHIRRGLAAVLAGDPCVDRSLFGGAVTPEALCEHVWEGLLASLRRGDGSCAVLFALLGRALYPDRRTSR